MQTYKSKIFLRIYHLKLIRISTISSTDFKKLRFESNQHIQFSNLLLIKKYVSKQVSSCKTSFANLNNISCNLYTFTNLQSSS